MPRILITGTKGQIGSELIDELRAIYGREEVVGSDIQKPDEHEQEGPYIYLDVLDVDAIAQAVVDYDIDWIVHNASLLSATGERNPHLAMKVNGRGFENAIEVARKYNLRILAPSSIAAFGASTPSVNTPDVTIMRPDTMYGITKVWVELLGEYYHKKWDVDFRSLRYPGIISWKALPGGGTTDYAVEIFYEALKHKKYTSFLKPGTVLPMMYMPDCIKGTIELLQADNTVLEQRVFNLGAMSFGPEELAAEITKHIPEFEVNYEPDYRQAIADGWIDSVDDSEARRQWNWSHDYDLARMTHDMLNNLSRKLNIPFMSPIQ